MNYPFAIIKRWKLWLLIAGLLSAGSIAMFFWTVRYSIQFTGGMEFVVSTKDVQPSVQQDIEGALSQA
jgi:preprotein translocase subunit SecF